MAYFRLSLLTPYTAVDKTEAEEEYKYTAIYFEDLITEFNSQLDAYNSIQNHTYYKELQEEEDKTLQEEENKILTTPETINPSYSLSSRKSSTSFSYAEKFTLSQNGQKTLSFSMNKYIVRENEYVENPFTNLIQDGSQLLLVDQYLNEYMFTVTNIKYTIKETNSIYEYTCQDSFTYQISRQNQEYFIDNDPNEADFIGPKTADWWIVHKVVPECYLANYQYIPCSRCLYENTKGQYVLCDNSDGKSDVKRIIKEPHSWDEENYYTTFAYSCSGMNAASVLIDIAAKINMQLKVCEHARITEESIRTREFDRYFWIEPLKNDQRIGLTYSPRRDIQSFDLAHAGQSLSTVMTVSGPTYNDEIITLIPDIPLFFRNYFLRPEWKTIDYNSGLFTQACQGQSFVGKVSWTNDDLNVQSGRFIFDTSTYSDNKIYIQIYNTEDKTFIFDADLYQHFSFNDDDYLVLSDDTTVTPRSQSWFLAQESDENEGEYVIFYPGKSFNTQIDKDKPLFLYILLDESIDNLNLKGGEVTLRFFRDVTAEELEFAEVADACPWLENKLIDFNYFKQANIITEKEYGQLINILYNDLRKVNGRLIYYTQSYYKALHDKTEMIANLTNQLDSLGAACQAAIVDSLAVNGKVQDISYFRKAYNTVFNAGQKRIMGLLDYNLLISDYFTKYFNAEQRFLKNIYNFRKYFNDTNPLDAKALYRYTIEISKPADVLTQKTFYGFSGNNKFISLNNSNYPYIYYAGYTPAIEDSSLANYGECFLPIYLNEQGRLTQITVASKNKWTNGILYRYPNYHSENRFLSADEQGRYNEQNKYLKLSFKLEVKKNNNGNYYWEQNGLQYKISERSTKNYQQGVNTYNSNQPLYGLYRIKIEKDGDSYSTICKMNSIQKEDTQYYAYLTQLHQGKWIKNNEEDYVDMFTLFENISFETSSYIELEDDILQIEPVTYSTSANKYNSFISGVSFVPEMSYVGLIAATVQDIKENWIYTHYDNNNVFIKKTPLYRKFYDTINALSELFKFASVQLFAFCNPEITEDDLKNDHSYFSNTIIQYCDNAEKRDWAKKYYIKYFPINDFYIRQPRYRVTEKNDGLVFERLNEKNQSFTDFLEYFFNEQSPNAQYKTTEVKNPYSFYEYKRLNYVTEDNESQFYRRVINHPNMGMASGLGTTGTGVTVFGMHAPRNAPSWILTGNKANQVSDAVAESIQHWDVKGITSRDFFGNELATRFSGYRPDNLASATIYAATENSFEKFCKYGQAFGQLRESTGTETQELHSLAEWNNRFKDGLWDNAVPYTASDENDAVVVLTATGNKNVYSYLLEHQHMAYDYQGIRNLAVNNTYVKQLFNWILAGSWNKWLPNNYDTSVYFVDKEVEVLTSNKLINKNDNIFMLWIATNDKKSLLINDTEENKYESFKTFLNSHSSFSAAAYYPLVNNMQKINLASVAWNVDNKTLRNIIKDDDNWTIDSENNQILEIRQTGTGIRGTAVFFRIKDYQEQTLKDYLEIPDNIAKSFPRLFDTKTFSDLNYLEEPDIVQGYYKDVNLTTELTLAKDTDADFNMDAIYYDATGTRIYTIKQLKTYSNYVYLHSHTYETEEVGDVSKFNINLSQYIIEIDDLGSISSIKENPLDDIYNVQFNFVEGNENSATRLVINDNTTIELTCTKTKISDISGLSNGTFWNNYHTSVDNPVLFSTAAAIEAQLTEYWNQAYTASKFCEYFLPESWTPVSNQKDNKFSKNIFFMKNIGTTEEPIYRAELYDTFLPIVQIVQDDRGSAILKRYKFSYSIDPASSIEHFANERYVLEDQTAPTISSTNIILNNFALRNALQAVYGCSDDELIEPASKWFLEEIGTTTYYYSNIGGTSWKQLVQQSIDNSEFNEYDGWYIMAIRWLKQYYQDWKLTEYIEAQKEHNAIWRKLYQNYGHILLENSFKSETATSSLELLKEAQLQFKDRTQPERQYNITIIDAASLDNYQGAEIRIGDGIRVKANDYVNEYDNLYPSLIQYLFITDINYTLRDPANISLTVNDIKYADTVVKRLAKLIK